MSKPAKSKIRSLLNEARLASRKGDEEAELNFRKEIIELDPANTMSWFQYGATCLMHDRLAEAIRSLDALKEMSPAKMYRQLKVDYLVDTESYDELLSLLDQWSVADPEANADAFNLTIRAWLNSGEPVFFERFGAFRLFSQTNFMQDAIGLFYHVKTPDDIEWRDQQISTDPSALIWFVNLVESLIDHGEPERALRVAVPFKKALSEASNVDPGLLLALQETISIGEYIMALESRPHQLIEEDYSVDLLRSEVRSPGKVAFIFTGLNGRALVGNRILDHYLSELGHHTVFLRDSQRYAFGKGVRSLGNTRQHTIDFMRKVCETQTCADPLIIGTSIGTFGAISHGIPMGASRFALFGPVAAAGDKEFLLGLGDTRGPALLKRAAKVIPVGERLMSDFIKSCNRSLDIKVIYNANDTIDRQHTAVLNGLEGVTPVEIPDAGSHNALRSALAQKRLDSIIA